MCERLSRPDSLLFKLERNSDGILVESKLKLTTYETRQEFCRCVKLLEQIFLTILVGV